MEKEAAEQAEQERLKKVAAEHERPKKGAAERAKDAPALVDELKEVLSARDCNPGFCVEGAISSKSGQNMNIGSLVNSAMRT